MPLKVLAVFTVLLLNFAAPAAFSAEKVDPSGTWKWKREFEGNTVESVLKLKLDGDKITGTYTRGELKSDVQNGKVDGDQISFDISGKFNDTDVALKFKGKLEKDAIKGTVNLAGAGQSGDLDWEAKRGLDFEDVVGKWQLKVETPDRVYEPVLELSLDKDKKPAGKYIAEQLGELKLEDISIKDAELLFKVTVERDDNKIIIAYTAKPAGDAMKGGVKVTFNDNPFDVEFTGKRVVEEKKDKAPEKK